MTEQVLEKNKREYFKNIDFLRILLCLGIILRHIRNSLSGKAALTAVPLYQHIVNNNLFGNIPVDCFFIISGFFLFFTTNFAQNFYQFALKKLIRLLPVVVFATLLYHILLLVLVHKGVTIVPDTWVLLMLHNVGLTDGYSTLANTWYLSVLFWVSCLYFYVYKIIDKKWFNLIMAGCVFLGYAFYLHAKLGNPDNAYYIVNYGVMRGIAGMALGYFIYNMYNDFLGKIRAGSSKIWQKLLCSAAEIFLLIFIFRNIFYKPMHYENKLLIILAFAVLLILFIAKQGYISKLLENNISAFIGKFTFSIYVMHVLARNIWIKYVYVHYPQLVIEHSIWNVAAIYILGILLGVIAYYLVERPSIKFLGKKLAGTDAKVKTES